MEQRYTIYIYYIFMPIIDDVNITNVIAICNNRAVTAGAKSRAPIKTRYLRRAPCSYLLYSELIISGFESNIIAEIVRCRCCSGE